MYIGELNEKLTDLHFSVYVAGTDITPSVNPDADPFSASPRTLQIGIGNDHDPNAEIRFGFSGGYYINGIEVELLYGKKGTLRGYKPNRLTLRRADGSPLGTYAGETGRPITSGTVYLPAEDCVGEFSLTIESDYSLIAVNRIRIIGADFSGSRLFPIPQNVSLTGKSFPVSMFPGTKADNGFAAAARVLAEKWREKTGLELTSGADGIRFMRNTEVPAEGCRISIAGDGITVRASDLRGAVWGAETLIKLIDGSGKDAAVPEGGVTDAPASEFRGVHLALPSEENLTFFCRLVKYLISPMGYNFIILELGGGVRYTSHPEIAEAYSEARRLSALGRIPPFPHGHLADGRPLDTGKVREIAEYIKQFGIKPVPELSSLSHAQYLTWAHPETGERAEAEQPHAVDENAADVPPSSFYAGSWCPCRPEAYSIYFDIADEIIDLMKPEYFHIGHDEVYQIGLCPLCRSRDPAKLFADDVNRIYAHLESRGVKTMMWSDMLQPVTSYKTPPAADMLPRDILMLDFIWYFHMDKDIENNLTEKGFPVIFGNLYSSHFPRYEKRRYTPGVHGGQISSWVGTDEWQLGKEGKIYDFIYTANMLWTRTEEHARRSYESVIRGLIPEVRDSLRDTISPSRVPGHSEKALESGDRADSLIIEHTALSYRRRIPWAELPVTGVYEIMYADGTSAEIPVTYGGNIGYCRRRQNEPLPSSYYRHNGYTATYFADSSDLTDKDGGTYTLYRLEWLNPHPEKAVASVTYVPADDTEIKTERILSVRLP